MRSRFLEGRLQAHSPPLPSAARSRGLLPFPKAQGRPTGPESIVAVWYHRLLAEVLRAVASNRLPFFIAGFGLGAALGLVLAPKRGEQTRADLLRAAEDGREFVAEASGTVRTMAADVVERGISVAESQKDLLQAALDAGLRAYRMADQSPG